ncbi:MAG: hypothetical protein HONBIEJF_02051 [Fimbriimonadaceae bacterium]|nr:hypothetical protein [Fimbriimonadaceae bacterium]
MSAEDPPPVLALILATSIGLTQDSISHGTRGATPSFTQQRIQVPTAYETNVQVTEAFAVNDAGWTVGYYQDPGNSAVFVGYIWDNAKHINSEWSGGDADRNMVRLGELGGDDVRVADINDTSPAYLVGRSRDGQGRDRAVFWSTTGGLNTANQISNTTFNWDAEAVAVNNDSPPAIVGWGEISDGGARKAFYRAGGGTITQIPGFGGSGVTTGDVMARDVNDGEEVVGHGFRTVSGVTRRRAFSWTPGDNTLTLLALPTGYDTSDAFAVNNAGNIVGWMSGPSNPQRACIWSSNGATASILVQPGGVELSEARDINASGHACGRARIGGVYHGVVWIESLTAVYRADQVQLGGYPGRIDAFFDINAAPNGLLTVVGSGVSGSRTEGVIMRSHLALGPGRSSGKAIGSVSFDSTGSSDLDLPAGGQDDAHVAYEYDSSPDELGMDRANTISISPGGSVSPSSVSVNDETSESGTFTCTANPGSEGMILTVSFEIDGQSVDYAYQRNFGTIRVHNAAPTIGGLSPSSVEWGSADTPITVTGTKFVGVGLGNWSDSEAYLNGAAVPTAVTSSTQLIATAPAAQLTAPATLPVTVRNIAPGGGTSNSVDFTVTKAATSMTAGNYQGERLQTIQLSATLKRTSSQAPLGNKTVQFEVDGLNVGSAVTSSTGTATLSYLIPQNLALGAHSVKASFDGDTLYFNSSVTTTLTVVNSAPVASLAGSALRFDGTNDKVQFPDFGLVAPTSAITIEMWVKADVGKTQYMMVTENQNAANRIGINGPGNSGAVRFEFGTVSMGGLLSDTITGLTGSWNHLTFVAEDGVLTDKMEVYKNGVLEGSSATASTYVRTAVDLLLAGSTSAFFDGEIDEVRIWNRAKTATEILRDYRSQLTGTESGLNFMWCLDEAAGLVTNDLGSVGLDGNLLNGPTWIASGATIDTVNTYEELATPIRLGGFDPDGDPLTYEIVTQPSNGSISGTLPNMIYTGDRDFVGVDKVGYRVSDGSQWSDEFMVTINVGQRDFPANYVDYSVGPQGAEVGAHNAANLSADDGTRATFQSTVVPNQSIPPIKVTIDFTSTIVASDAEAIEISLNAQSQFANIEQRLSLINQTNGTLLLLDSYTFTTANSDRTRTAMTSTDVSKYISNSNRIQVVAQYIKVGVIPQAVFRSRIDHAQAWVRKKI